MQQCQSCGGTFDAINADGTLYFHVCPPLSAVELAAAVAAGAVQLPIDPATKLPETADDAIVRRTYTRANVRNENVTGPALKDGDDAPIVSHGAGVADVVRVLPPATVVVTLPAAATAPDPRP